MKLLQRTGLLALVVGVTLLAFTGLRSAKPAEASGPYNGMYTQVCIQTGFVYVSAWQFDGYTWRWLQVAKPVCLRWATVAIYQPVYPTYPIYYTPISACGPNGCIYQQPFYGNQQPFYGNMVGYPYPY
jgi:hypothetical protein